MIELVIKIDELFEICLFVLELFIIGFEILLRLEI
jgi:hypothetical protein